MSETRPEKVHACSIQLSFSFTGKTKCMSKSGDCVVKHGANFVTGMGMVVGIYNTYCVTIYR